MFVDETQLNGRVTAQGYSSNSGSSFYQQYYNNLFNNGLQNSNGYPLNLRKISLTNGSVTGKRIGFDNEMVLNLRGFKRMEMSFSIGSSWSFPIHIASVETNFMPTYNTGLKKIARLKKGFDDYYTVSQNINTRGNLDSVPGGWFPSQNDIAKTLIGRSPVDGVRGSFWQYTMDNIEYFFINNFGGAYWDLREFRFNNSFIPTFSSLGIKNPNRDWSESLQRNLLCTSETPFDSYYGDTENTQHTSFTENSINFLLKELGDNINPPSPQVPWFPIDATSFLGPDKVCLNNPTTYSFTDICKIPGAPVWSVTSNLQILSSTSTTLTVSATDSGLATIYATFQNGQIFKKEIWLGVPNFKQFEFVNDIGVTLCIAPINQLHMDLPTDRVKAIFDGVSIADINNNANWEWQTTNNLISLNSTNSKNFRSICPNDVGFTSFKVRARNSCGWSEWYEIPQFEVTNISQPVYYKIAPNPVNTILEVLLKDFNKKPQSPTAIAKIYDILGNQRATFNISNYLGKHNISNLPTGTYYLKIHIGNKIENITFIKQ